MEPMYYRLHAINGTIFTIVKWPAIVFSALYQLAGMILMETAVIGKIFGRPFDAVTMCFN